MSKELRRIRYNSPPEDNAKEVYDFIRGHWYHCNTCGGTGEYEGEYGPVACQLCCSRLISFIDCNGVRQDVDWGDYIVQKEDGFYLERGGG